MIPLPLLRTMRAHARRPSSRGPRRRRRAARGARALLVGLLAAVALPGTALAINSPKLAVKPGPASTSIALGVAPRAQIPRSTLSEMLAAINSLRAHYRAPRVEASTTLSQDAGSYARSMLVAGRFEHARDFLSHTGFREVGEILARVPTEHPMIAATLEAWLASPEHRAILLDPQFRFVGIGRAAGRMDGLPTFLWVVRFGRH